ncbi:MAG TPA: glutaredoxin domain-containing protein [Polyangiaceae bacterium]|nr:glutaredoxin domain-containing protein [Polyangiaceae bacterium]
MPSSETNVSSPPADVVMFRTPFCGYCVMAARLLAKKGANVREIDVSGNSECRKWLYEVTGMRTVPQVFINGRSVRGFEDLVALDRRGQLDPLLREAPTAASLLQSPCAAPL